LKQTGKKEGGLGEGIFARLRFPRRRRDWGRSVSAIPPKAEYQNRKIFFSLIEKNFWGARLKKCRKNFSVLVPPKRSGGERKRTDLFWILFKESSNIVQEAPPIYNFNFFE